MPTRRALLIAINEYEHFNNLQGCENDARDLLDVLQSRYAFTHCRTLFTKEATGSAIRSALKQLIDETEAGDAVVFFYAGHGSQMRDLDGDEPSGFDNTLVPYDSKHDAANPELNTDVVDDEIRLLLETLTAKTENVTVIVDACHSGTITRGAEALVTGTRGVEPYLGPPPSHAVQRAMSVAGTATRSAGTPYTLLASARDTELAKEIGLPQKDGTVINHGAFSYYLVSQLRTLSVTPTVRQLFEQVAADMYDLLGGRQRPQLEGSYDRRLFGLDTVVPMPYLRLLASVDAERCLKIAGGSSLGLDVGARIAVYAPDTTTTEGATPLARGTVVEVLAVESVVRLDGVDALPPIPLTARVVVESPAPSQPRRPVCLAPLPTDALSDDVRAALEAAHAQMRTELSAEASFTLVDAVGPDTLIVCLWPPAGEGQSWRWAVTAADGLPLTPLKALEATAAVRTNCKVLTRQWLVKRLVNGADESALRQGRVKAEFLTAPAVKQPFAVAPPGPDGVPVVRHADMPWGLRVHNGHDKDVYVTLIDFALEGSIVQLFPPNDAASETAIPPNGQYEIFTQPTRLKGYALPSQYPWVADGALPARDDAMTSLRLFVTERPVDFRFLCSTETVRSSAVGTGTLESFLAEQLGVEPPPATRGATDLSAPPDTDWTAIDVRFVVRRERPTALPTDLDRALQNAGFTVRQTLDVQTRSTDGRRSVQLDPVPDGYARVLLVVGEDGLPQFVYPDLTSIAGTRSTSGDTKFEYELPITAGLAGGRSVGALLAIPQVKDLIVKKIDPIFGKIGAAFAAQVEERVRPYGFRRVTRDAPAAWPLMHDGDWSALTGGKVLVLLHGLLGTGASTFGGIDTTVMERWLTAYDGRVLVFDHPTIGHDPHKNAEAFVRLIPDGTTLTTDMIGLSRGGLVARVLAEEFATLQPGARQMTVGKVVQIGTPNGGTPLADPQALQKLTNVLSFLEGIESVKRLGDTVVAAGRASLGVATGGTADLLWPLVRQAAVAMVSSLPGLESLEPKSAFLTQRPRAGAAGTRYYAIVSSLEKREGLGIMAARALVGTQLGTKHDLFVSADSTLSSDVSFAETLVLEEREAVTHLGFVQSAAALRALNEWLVA